MKQQDIEVVGNVLRPKHVHKMWIFFKNLKAAGLDMEFWPRLCPHSYPDPVLYIVLSLFRIDVINKHLNSNRYRPGPIHAGADAV